MARRLAGAFLAVAACAAFAWTAGLLPGMAERGLGPREGIAVFSEGKAAALTDGNLVDWLSAARPASMELKRAEWDGRTLSLDFRADAGALDEERLFGDLSDLVVAALAGTENVDRLMVRIFDPYGAPGERRLLLALDAGRGAFDAVAQEARPARGVPAKAWLSRHFRLTGPLR